MNEHLALSIIMLAGVYKLYAVRGKILHGLCQEGPRREVGKVSEWVLKLSSDEQALLGRTLILTRRLIGNR